MWTAASNDQIARSRATNGKNEVVVRLIAEEHDDAEEIDVLRVGRNELERSRRPIDGGLHGCGLHVCERMARQ